MATAKVDDLMREKVVTVNPQTTLGHIQTIFKNNKFNSLPVVDDENTLQGIISKTDLVSDFKTESPVTTLMSEKVYTVPRYEKISIAARIMRNHKIHQLVVTHEKKVVGIITSFDLLKLVEDHSFTMKGQAPTKSAKH
jgi:CBS domain-containing protein